MLKRLRENKSAQGTLLASPTMLWMLALLIIPLLLTLVVSFGKRSPDGEVIYTFSIDNYLRLVGVVQDFNAAVCASTFWGEVKSILGPTIGWSLGLALAYLISRGLN